ncbi:hypothetical protein ACKKBG_A00640 [Auxenochlorella protothecoides x Auxenochlorella symbiontica]
MRRCVASLNRRVWAESCRRDRAWRVGACARALTTDVAREQGATARAWWAGSLAVGASFGLGAWYLATHPGPALAKDVSSLPEYSKEEVAKHRTPEDRVWVTYKEGVYDITDWVDIHPGGKARLMMAAGSAIDPFWSMYQHHNTQQVRDILEGYRIGSLEGGAPPPPEDPYADDPKDRLPALIVRSARPMNAEPPRELLTGSVITPTEVFYIRNHLPVPRIDEAQYSLRIEGQGIKTLDLSLDRLKAEFRKHTVTATVQCSGNRRNDFYAVKDVKGLEWGGAAIGTAVWGGVRLGEVLQAAGLDPGAEGVRHVQFFGADADGAGQAYAASIPVHRALDPRADVLLAYEMNGAPLTRDHGAPLRVIVPGTAGCRSVKWVTKIVPSGEEADSLWQRRDYKAFSPSVGWDEVDWDSAPAIQAMPVTSLICEPAPGARVEPGDLVTVKGYAWSGGGNRVIRVDVTADGGATWHTAELEGVEQEEGRNWAWVLWSAEVEVPGTPGEVEIAAKATDASYNTQPEAPGPIWNLRGVNCNSWPRIRIVAEEAQ